MPSQEKLTADAFDSPPDTEQSSACQEPPVNPALFWHGRHPSAIVERVIEQGGEWDCADGKVHKRRIESRVRRRQQEPKYTSRVVEVGQTQSECKPNCAAERDRLARVYTHARGSEGRNESCDAARQKNTAVSAKRRVTW